MTDTVWLKDKEVGKRFGSTRQWVWEMARTHPKFPQPVKLTTRWTRWSLKEIEAFESVMLENKCHQYDPFHDFDPPKCEVMDEAEHLEFLKQVAGGCYLEDPSEIKQAQDLLDEMGLE